jgi:putative transposase
MARKLRVEYPDAVYHVMNRGDRREPIFRDDADWQRFVNTLGEACGKTGWQVHAHAEEIVVKEMKRRRWGGAVEAPSQR